MRIAVISDIHGNRLALEAALADIAEQGCDLTLNLGDMVSGPMEPGRTAELLRERAFPSIAGNHDRYLISGSGLRPVDRFALGELTPAQFDWFGALPKTLVVNGDIFMCHGTPRDDDAPWLDTWFRGRDTTLPDEASIAAEAAGLDYPVLLCGHTHLARAVRLEDGRLVVNPGSIGLQLVHGSPDVRYAILDRQHGHWAVSLRALPYDHAAAARQAERHGFPAWTEALSTGWAGPEGLF